MWTIGSLRDNASTDNKWSEKGERCMVPGKCLSSVLPRGDDRSVKLDPKVSPAQSMPNHPLPSMLPLISKA